MTVALSLRVHEGLVLATDSASTVMGRLPNGTSAVINVYNNANKIFNLRKGSPIGAITWGVGAMAESSIAMLMKALRAQLTEGDSAINPDQYRMEDIASRVKEFIFDQHYAAAFADWNPKPDLGFIVAGYSTDGNLPEEYHLEMKEGQLVGPNLIREGDIAGATWNGQIEALTRLLVGSSPMLPEIVKETAGLSDDIMVAIINPLQARLNPQLVQPSMPLKDAIDLATCLVDVAIRFSQFSPGAPLVGGPIEVAAISKYEGFTWVERKYYYTADLNPETADVNRNSMGGTANDH